MHQGQQLHDATPLHHDLLEHPVVPAPPAGGRHSLEEWPEGRVIEKIRPPDERAPPVDADEMDSVAVEDGPAQARHFRGHLAAAPWVGVHRESARWHATGNPYVARLPALTVTAPEQRRRAHPVGRPVGKLRELPVNLVDQFARPGHGGTEEILACDLEDVEEGAVVALHHHADHRPAVKRFGSRVDPGDHEVQLPGRLVEVFAPQSRTRRLHGEVPGPGGEVRDTVQPPTAADHLLAVRDVLLVSLVRVIRLADDRVRVCECGVGSVHGAGSSRGYGRRLSIRRNVQFDRAPLPGCSVGIGQGAGLVP